MTKKKIHLSISEKMVVILMSGSQLEGLNEGHIRYEVWVNSTL